MLFIITREDCPYCAAAKENILSVLRDHPELNRVKMEFLTETAELTGKYDYYYSPAYFWDKEKLAEGVFAAEDIAEVLRRALELQDHAHD